MTTKRREGVRIRRGDTDYVIAPDPDLEVIREVAKRKRGIVHRVSGQTPQDSRHVPVESPFGGDLQARPLGKKYGEEWSELDDPDQDIHPKNVGVRVGIPSYIAQAEGDVTPSEEIKPITPEEGGEGAETGYEGSEGGEMAPQVGRATGHGVIPEAGTGKKKIKKHLPGKHDQKTHGGGAAALVPGVWTHMTDVASAKAIMEHGIRISSERGGFYTSKVGQKMWGDVAVRIKVRGKVVHGDTPAYERMAALARKKGGGERDYTEAARELGYDAIHLLGRGKHNWLVIVNPDAAMVLRVDEGVEKGKPAEPMDTLAHTGNKDETSQTGIVTTNQGVAGSQDVQDSRNAPITLAEIAHAEMLMRLAAMGINKAKTNPDSDLPSRIDKRGPRRWPSPLERVNMEIGRTKRAMEATTRSLWRGELDLDAWHDRMRAAVDDLYGKSAYASTLRLKETPEARQRARDNLMMELRHQRHYLERFRDDVAAGRITENQAAWRAKLYADGSAGLYHQTVSEGQPQMKGYWNLTPGAEHCTTCLEMATLGPWPANQMPRLPRDGSTICRSNCRCYLTYRKARPTLRPVRRKKSQKSR